MKLVGEFAPFVPYCFLACYVAFIFVKPGLWEWALVTAAGAVLGLGFVLLHAGLWISGLGVAAALWALLAPFVGRKTVPPAIALLALYPFIASAAVLAINPSRGLTLDRYILAADGSFGFLPGFATAQFMQSHPAIGSLCEIFYFALPVAAASLLHTASSRRLMLLCGLLAVSALVAYIVFPAVGSRIAFADRFPDHPPVVSASFGTPMFEPGGIQRNFMPSLHAAWGIALLLVAWPLGRAWRVAILIYLVPMLFYALARHYLCDIIVAVPWTFACWSVIAKRWRSAAAYLAIAVGWMLLIRFGLPLLYPTPVIPWLLTAATLAVPAIMPPGPSPGIPECVDARIFPNPLPDRNK